MNIYLAAPYPEREQAIAVMTLLEARGHTVTSRWLKELDALSDKDARKDLEDIRHAEVFLALNYHSWNNRGTGGRHFEMGYAYALNKLIILAGDRVNMFHHLETIKVIELTDDAILKALDLELKTV